VSLQKAWSVKGFPAYGTGQHRFFSAHVIGEFKGTVSRILIVVNRGTNHSLALIEMFDEKNHSSKFLWQCPFKKPAPLHTGPNCTPELI